MERLQYTLKYTAGFSDVTIWLSRALMTFKSSYLQLRRGHSIKFGEKVYGFDKRP